MQLSGMRQTLEEDHIQLTKSLGQSFLHDRNQLRRIVELADLRKGDKVLEIGPGLGPLTELLVAEASHVLAIEKDERLVKALRDHFKLSTSCELSGEDCRAEMRQGAAPVLQLVHDDALAYLRRETLDWTDWKLVANLPYSVASPILVELAQAKGGPERMVVTLQREVAQRLVGKRGGE